MLTYDQIESKVAELTKAREQFLAQAERSIANMDGRIAALKELLAEPKEAETVTPIKGGKKERAFA